MSPKPAAESISADASSLVQGGPIYRILAWLRITSSKTGWPVWQRCLFAIALTWAPLLILSIVDRQAYSGLVLDHEPVDQQPPAAGADLAEGE